MLPPCHDAALDAGPSVPAGYSPCVADRIPLGAEVVVHLGCGDGRGTAVFRRCNPRARLIGIEADPVLAGRAAAVLDVVYCLAAEPGPLPALPPADCILVSPGVVDRLAAPIALLGELGRCLAPGGVLVAWLAPGSQAEQRAGFAEAGLHLLDAEAVTMDGAAFVVWRATAAPMPRLRIFSSMLPPIGGVSQVRVVEPLSALAAEPAIATEITNEFDALPSLDGAAGIFILHRPALLGAEGLARIRGLMARGWLVVCEFDDHPSQIPILYRSDVQNFRAVHAIQTSTPALAEVLGRENPAIAVFPNAIRRLPPPVNFAVPGQVTLLFAALNREEDWPEHVTALNDAAAASRGALRFHVIADRAFFDALATPHKVFTPLCDYAGYLEILSRCEVSFMPLRDTLFNRCKSDLKYLEAASHRAVALASRVVYGQSIRDGETGLVFDEPAGLHERLMRVVADPAAARALAERGRTDVAQHRMLAYQMRARVAWYRDLWSRRAELHAALLRRVPELAVSA